MRRWDMAYPENRDRLLDVTPRERIKGVLLGIAATVWMFVFLVGLFLLGGLDGIGS